MSTGAIVLMVIAAIVILALLSRREDWSLDRERQTRFPAYKPKGGPDER